jgi:hypothetical protein
MNAQLDFFDPLPAQDFERWLEQPGARQVMRHCYAEAAPFAVEYMRTGVPVSMKLVWELVRHRIKHGRARLVRAGGKPSRWKGYALNNSLTASVARHILAHRLEWAGMFELRDEWGGQARSKRTRVIVIPAAQQQRRAI